PSGRTWCGRSATTSPRCRWPQQDCSTRSSPPLRCHCPRCSWSTTAYGCRTCAPPTETRRPARSSTPCRVAAGQGGGDMGRRALGELEAQVLRVLWEQSGPVSAGLIQEQLPGPSPAYTTVLTVLDRLAQKGLVLRSGESPRKVRFRA